MTDPRQPVLDHLAVLRRERWKLAAWFVGTAAVEVVVAVGVVIWATEKPSGSLLRYAFVALGLFNAWSAASIVVSLRTQWRAILLMERTTRAQLAWFDLLEQHGAFAPITRCPWCGMLGPDFDESPRPSDVCHHDPAEVRDDNALSSSRRQTHQP